MRREKRGKEDIKKGIWSIEDVKMKQAGSHSWLSFITAELLVETWDLICGPTHVDISAGEVSFSEVPSTASSVCAPVDCVKDQNDTSAY
ncbi:hypothetical protein SDJN03_05497, partial [Cucurbita argyrosperma subsp. sororia]